MDRISALRNVEEAPALTGASTTEFALAAFVETHDPVPGARDALEGALAPVGDAAVAKRDSLKEAIGDGPE